MEDKPEEDDNEGKNKEDENKDAIVVFFSTTRLQHMRSSKEFSLDGTFDTAPPTFKQIVFIQAKQEGKRAIPVVHALLTRKVW